MILRISSLIAAISILLTGCASQRVVSHPLASKDFIFPSGVYHHDVTLSIHPSESTDQSKGKKYEFNGVVRLSASEITIVVLSYFGTTEFKIHENLKSGEITVETYQSNLKKIESKLRDYYSILRSILLAKAQPPENETLKWTKVNDLGLPTEIDGDIQGAKTRFELSDYDQNQIPGTLKIDSAHFTVLVKVTGYEI